MAQGPIRVLIIRIVESGFINREEDRERESGKGKWEGKLGMEKLEG